MQRYFEWFSLSLNKYFGRRVIQAISYTGPDVGMYFLHKRKNVGFSLK